MRKSCHVLIPALLALLLSASAQAAFEKTNTYADGQFADVPSDAWYASEVQSTYELGLMNGIGGGLFDPEGNVTVAEAITMAARSCAINTDESIPASGGEWYQMYLNYAFSKGFVAAGQFENYDRPAKRYEVAQLFENAMPDGYFAAKNDVSDVHDIPDSRSYKAAVVTLYKAGVMMGSDAFGTFNPEYNITRAEAAAIINRVALPENRLVKTLDKITNDDAYTFIKTPTFTTSKGVFSGWALDNRGGLPRTSLTEPYGALIDVRENAGAALIREFNKTSTGKVDLYAGLMASGDGVYVEFRNEAGDSVYRVDYRGGKWLDGETALYTAADGENDFHFNIVLDLDNDRADTYINGTYCGRYPLRTSGDETNILSFRIATTDKDKPVASVSSVSAYNNYALFEDFSETADGTVPKYFTLGEGASVVGGTLTLGSGAAFAGFDATSGRIIAESTVLLPQKESVSFTLSSGDIAVLTFTTDEKNLFVNGSKVYENYVANLWYRLRFELDTDSQTILVKLNGRKLTTVPFAAEATSVNALSVANLSETAVKFDDFKVFRYIEHADYCPAPIIPAGADDYTIGINVCSLWKNGATSNSQWSTISPFADREPVLGYYDEGLPETADWEIKYMLEHGIDFQAFCMFFNTAYAPIKLDDDDNAAQLFDGFMNAKYADMAKYCILWEAGAANPASLDSMKNYFAPFIVEYFLKDPRYMVIDNKPVICMYAPGTYSKAIGGNEQMKESFDYLEGEAKKLGFDGILFLACGASSKTLADMGFDGCYAYHWGQSGTTANGNIESISASAAEGSVYTVPTVSVGFNSMAWHGTRYPLISETDYEKAHKWVRDEYLPKNAKEDWQKSFVMISTWNEYGEGTYISPTTRDGGFAYLDIIRDVYTKGGRGGAVVDVVPTAAQKYRINRLYPQYRKVLRKEGYPVADGETDYSDYTAIYTVDYSQMTINGGTVWKAAEASVTKEGITGTTGSDTAIVLSDLTAVFESTDPPFLDSLSAIRVTAKLSEGAIMELFYITEDDKAWSASKSKKFEKSKGDEWDEYVIDINSWKGKLRGLRLDPAVSAGASFTIKTLELLTDENAVSNIISIDGESFNLEFAPERVKNGHILLPFDPAKAVDFRLGCYYEWNKDDGVLALHFIGHDLTFTVGSKTYTVDGKEKNMDFALEAVDSLPKIPLDIVCEEVGYTLSISPIKQIEITTGLALPQKDESAGTVGQWEFDAVGDTENWTSSFMSLMTYNGYLSCTSMSTSTDPTINYGKKLNVPALKYNKLEIRVRYRYSAANVQNMQLFFTTDKATGMSEDKSIKIKLNSKDSGNEFEVYTYDLTQLSSWQDTIVSLRFDPFNATGNMDIDYIRLIEDPTVSDEKLEQLQQQKAAEEYAKSKEYPVPDFGIKSDEYGYLIWYSDFEVEPYTDATYAQRALKFTAGGVGATVEIVDSPSGDGKALKVTPNAAHGGYHVGFPNALREKGDYTFMADYYLVDGSKIDAWLRWETTRNGVKKDPSSWHAGKFITSFDEWHTYPDAVVVDDSTTAIHDFSIRKEKAEVYYLDNIKIYFKEH